MTVSPTLEPAHPSEEAARQGERRALSVACGAHLLHDGYTDLVWVALPIWQAEFGLSYAAVGLLRTVYSGTLASLHTHALSVFYTIAIGAAAVAPPFAGAIGDFIGIPATVMTVSALTLATIPFAFLLKDPRLGEQRT
jgi:fucose permease